MRYLVLMLTVIAAQAQSPAVQGMLDEARRQTDQQHFDESARLAQQAVDQSLAAADKKGVAAGYNELSRNSFFSRKLAAAVDAAEKALAVATETGDDKLIAAALGHEGDGLRDLGKLEDARAAYLRQRQFLIAAGDRKGEAINLRGTALLYRSMGDYEHAITDAQAALSLAQSLKDVQQEGQSLFVLGFLEGQQNKNDAALQHFNAALAIPSLDSLSRGQIVRFVGEIYCGQKRYDMCAGMVRQQLNMAVAAGNKEQIALAWYNLARPQVLMGAYQDAYESGVKALTTLRSTDHDPIEEWHFVGMIGEELDNLGKHAEAAPYFDEAIALVENLRQGLVPTEEAMAKAASDPPTRELFGRAIANRFVFDPAGAFRISELARARAFLSILAESKVDLRKGLSEADRKREAELFRRVRVIQKQQWRTSAEQPKNAELEAAESDLESFRLDIRKTNPRLADVQYPHPLEEKQIQQGLSPGQTLIEFSLGEDRSFAWAVSKEHAVSAALPPRKDIEDRVSAFRKAIAAPVSSLTASRSEAEVLQQAARLYTALLKPLESGMAGSSEIIIVPDGALYYVPFEALAAPGTHRYLMDRFPIRYAASATSFAEAKQETRSSFTKALLAFGDINYAGSESAIQAGFNLAVLPHTRDEVLGIANLFPQDQRSLRLGSAARLDSLSTESLDSYRYIHFATHGLLDEAHPGRSGLVLAPGPGDDGVLRVSSIAALRVNAEVVTLSACGTGLGQLESGEGMLGLVRAFLYAGAESVNVSLWNVNDDATSRLMKEFYRNLGKSNPAEALRQAKIRMTQENYALWRHPHFWAPFVLWVQ